MFGVCGGLQECQDRGVRNLGQPVCHEASNLFVEGLIPSCLDCRNSLQLGLFVAVCGLAVGTTYL